MILVAVGIQFGLQPYLGSLGARKIAKELQARYGLVVRYGDPAEFFVPPLERIDTKGSHIRIEAAQKRHVAVALKGVALALKKYPPDLIHRYLSAVFVARTLEIDGVTGAAMFANQWIYVATPARDGQAVQSFELSLHHELSSLFFYGGDFPTLRWHLVNDAQFRYLEDHANIIKAAAPANRQDPRKAREWYAAGFVSDYGMSSMENDVNTYAELAMGDPQKLRQLCDQYPRIAEKKKIFVGFYTRLAPELGAYFESEHLADGPSVQLPSALKKSPQEIRQELTAKNIK
jgi:hypothetical protein